VEPVSGNGPVETQPERTALAWQRTGLGVLAVGGLVTHGALLGRSPLLLALAGGTALLGLAMLGGLAPVRYRRLRQVARDAPDSAAVPGLLRAATAVVVLTGVAALVTVLAAARSSA
jgi:putative membrane protein